MIKHHPNINLLTEYVAGGLGIAQSISISAHIHLCKQCREQASKFEALGASVLNSASKEDISEDLLASVLNKIDQPVADTFKIEEPRTTPQSLAGLPPVLVGLIGNKASLKWKKLSKSLQVARLRTGQRSCEVSLHKIRAGGKILEHDHSGSEYTLVLKGSFSDENGIYQPGDFIHKQAGDVHRPYAAANRDCLCLTVSEAPVQFTGSFVKWLNPFIKIQPI